MRFWILIVHLSGIELQNLHLWLAPSSTDDHKETPFCNGEKTDNSTFQSKKWMGINTMYLKALPDFYLRKTRDPNVFVDDPWEKSVVVYSVGQMASSCTSRRLLAIFNGRIPESLVIAWSLQKFWGLVRGWHVMRQSVSSCCNKSLSLSLRWFMWQLLVCLFMLKYNCKHTQ